MRTWMATANFGMISTSTIPLAQLLCFEDFEKRDESMFKQTTENWRNWGLSTGEHYTRSLSGLKMVAIMDGIA